MASNRRKTLNQQDFVLNVIDTCLENKINLRLFNEPPEEGCSGYFSDDELLCLTNREDWIEILVHESCHMDQFLEDDPLYTHPLVKDFDIWDSSLLKHCPEKAEEAFKVWTEMEIDCDIRSVKKIKKYNLPIDVDEYIRRANCYHQSYYYFHKFHIFYDIKHPPFLDSAVVDTYKKSKVMWGIDEVWCENPALERFLVRHNSPI